MRGGVFMAKNKVQFQKGFALTKFNRRFSREAQCWQVVFHYRYPRGFVCTHCNDTCFYKIKRGQNIQCTGCRRQYSLRAGSIMQHSKLPFRIWFLAIYLISQNKKSISSLALKRYLDVSYNTAWLLHQKIMHALQYEDNSALLQGIIQVDDGYLGGKRSGVRGRGAKGKQAFLTALTLQNGKPDQAKLSLVHGFTYDQIAKWRDKYIAPFSTVYTDGLPAFRAFKTHNINHIVVNTSRNPQARDNLFLCINTLMGNLKRYILGIHHAIRAHRIARYLAAFAWRFNHRYDLKHAFNQALSNVFKQSPFTLRNFRDELCT